MGEYGECGYCGGSLGRLTSRSGPLGERLTTKPGGYISVETPRPRLIEYTRQTGKATQSSDGSVRVELSFDERLMLARWRRPCLTCGADHVVQFPRLREAINRARAEGRQVVKICGPRGDV